MADKLVMSGKERRRAAVLEMVRLGSLGLEEAADAVRLSLRQLRRLRRRVEGEGDAGLVHRARGRPARNRISGEQKSRILELATGRYSACNDSHLCELLAREHDLVIGRETLRRLLREAGKKAKRTRKPARYRARRTPSARRGELLLWDGSKHRWLGAEQPLCVLMAAIDDATGAIQAAFFCSAETTVAYLQLLAMVLEQGIPRAIYHDRHSSLVRSDGHWSLEEQLADRQNPTQVGTALDELGIQQILSYAPQGRGRIERLFRTLQDRLLAELQLDHIDDLDRANAFLRDVFVPRFNARFARKPADAAVLYRPAGRLDLRKILTLRYARTVPADNTVTLGSFCIQIPPPKSQRSYVHAKADIRQHLDGSWSVFINDKAVASHPSTQLLDPRRVRFRTRKTRHVRGADEVLLTYFPEDTLANTHHA